MWIRAPAAVTVWRALLLAGAIALVYAPAWPGAFIWDDDSALLENPLVRAPGGLARAWFSGEGLEYYPVFYTSLRGQWACFGESPGGYLAVNAAFHWINTLLFFTILGRLRCPGRLFASLCFALHPVNVFSVAWIGQHKTVLSSLFYLLCILLYLRSQERGSRGALAASVLFFAVGLLAKPTLVLLPVWLWLLGASGRTAGGERTVFGPVWRLLPFLVLALGTGLLRVAWDPPLEYAYAPPRVETLWEHLVLPGRAILFYLGKLLFPYGVMMIYPRWRLAQSGLAALIPTALACIAIALLFVRRRKMPLISLGLFFFVLGLMPVLGYFDNQYFTFSLVANHWLYMPMMGVAALAGGVLWRGLESSRFRYLRVALYALPVVFLVLARNQASRFCDPIVFYERGVAENADNVVAHQNLANLYVESGRADEALPHYLESVRIHPIFWQARNQAARIFIDRGDYASAVEQLRAALAIYPENWEAHLQLAKVFGQSGYLEAAVEHYVAALMINPNDAATFNNLGATYYRLGDHAQARTCFREALRLDPSSSFARRNLEILERK